MKPVRIGGSLDRNRKVAWVRNAAPGTIVHNQTPARALVPYEMDIVVSPPTNWRREFNDKAVDLQARLSIVA
jgi:hypothetical protein